MKFDDNSKTRISYILPTFNRANYLDDALKRFREIKTPNDELIIIDGKSSDNTDTVIDKNKDIIDVFISEIDLSEGHAYNKGILLASGKYIKPITDDDIFYSEALERAYEILENNPDLDILLAGGIRNNNGIEKPVYLSPGSNYGSNIGDVFKYGGCGLGLLFRRIILAKINLFNINAVGLDTDFITQAINGGATLKFCRLKMFYHPIEEHSGTVARNNEWKLDQDKIRKRYGYDPIYNKERTVIEKLKSHLIFKKINRVMFHLFRKNKAVEEKNIEDIEIIWDGGFS
tara:strand:- start:262 stop:1125 length:864 start_codon:yes stop_codon:yes gene_type:complete